MKISEITHAEAQRKVGIAQRKACGIARLERVRERRRVSLHNKLFKTETQRV
ncbi:hypothetical protein I8751_20055 [Nostocaceae cyanobacterium CENA357]|uniref:Uncharacterized protein n=1 Tax=Atlanticothrix silvestris CENA357 TaxID=1725252 RepID=A0A8J7HKY1_9CYAN|nr:hypothetical protein [Atlanticothrix silvestris CENA357]